MPKTDTPRPPLHGASCVRDGDDFVLRLPADRASALYELLEMAELDGFATDPDRLQEMADTREGIGALMRAADPFSIWIV